MKDRQKSNFNRKIYLAITVILLCLSVILLTYNVTMAWFVDESITSSGKPNITVIGTIDLNVQSNFDFYNLALAPDTVYVKDQNNQDIGTYLKTTTTNDVSQVYVRIRYTTTRSDKLLQEDINCEELTLYFDDNFTTETTYTSDLIGKWVYNNLDGYYYYLGGVGNTYIQFNAGYSTDNTLNNDKAYSSVDIKLEIEAIQRPYGAYKAVWTTAPQIFNDFAKADSGV